MNKIKDLEDTKSMKRFKSLLSFILILVASLGVFSSCPNCHSSTAEAKNQSTKPMLAIIIDDFGGYEQSGVETMLSIDAPLTCAIMPNLENTEKNAKDALASGKEVIVHMPMQAHVNLPLNWYGPTYIGNYDSKEQVYKKLDDAFKSVEGAKGFNIHIGSGVCQSNDVMGSVYDYAIEHNLNFVDSRTHMATVGDQVANAKHVLYMGRDEFLEPGGDKSYGGVKNHLMIGANLAKDRGYAIVIGHVGSHGGENTAKAIKDSIGEIRAMGIEIVPISKLHDTLNLSYVHQKEEEN